MRSDKEEKKNKQIIEVCSTCIYDELNNKDLYPEWKFGPNV